MADKMAAKGKSQTGTRPEMRVEEEDSAELDGNHRREDAATFSSFSDRRTPWNMLW